MDRIILVVGYIISAISTISAADITPKNTAVLSGAAATNLNCSMDSAPSNSMVWTFTAIGSTQYKTIVVGCNPPTLPQYGAQSLTSGGCNLIIYNANASFAGLYQCSSTATSTILSAQFIVLDGDPVCSTTPAGEVTVSQSVQMTCGTTVTGNMLPVMTWYNSTQQIPSPQVNSSGKVSSTITVQPMIPNIPSFTCKTTFSALTNQPAGYASNAPDYTSQCSTAELQVLYPPLNVSIRFNGDPDNVTCQDTLTCSAVAYPDPSYGWTVNGGSLSDESTVTTSVAGSNVTYTCTATNPQGSASASIMLRISECPTTTARPTTTTPTTTTVSAAAPQPNKDDSKNTGAIIGGVIGGVVGLILLIILLVCCCKESCPLYHGNCCHSKTPDKYTDKQSSRTSTNAPGADIVRTSSHPNAYVNPATNYDMTDIPSNQRPEEYGYTQNDGLTYAELALHVDNTPRSRQPIQSNTPTSDFDDDLKPPYDDSSLSQYNDRAVYAPVKRAY